jgi:hypothetical protein
VETLKKALLLFAAAAVVIGCGGGGTDAGGTTGGTGGTGGSGGRGVPTVNLSGEAQIQVLFASGQGRRAPGSQIAVIQDVQLQNSVIDFVPTTQQGSQSPLRIMLDGYSLNARLFSENLNGLPEKRTREAAATSSTPARRSRSTRRSRHGSPCSLVGRPRCR